MTSNKCNYAILLMTCKPLFLKQQLDQCLKIIKNDLLKYIKDYSTSMKQLYEISTQ
jgi:hypothetical protein